MPRLQPQRPQRFFRGSEFGRLMTMIGMCVVLVVMIKKASEPGMWQWLVSKPEQKNEVVQKEGANGKSAKVQPEKKQEAKSLSENRRGPSPFAMPGEQKGTVPLSADGSRMGATPPADVGANRSGLSPSPESAERKGTVPFPAARKIPAATGPTDEDPDEAEAAIEEYDYVSDGTLFITQEDNPAYERLVRWVIYQPFERLWARATQRNASYGQFLAAPRDFREPGKIFSFNLHLRAAKKFDVKMTFDNPDEEHEPVTLYEMWGTTDESRGRFFHLIVYDPPAGLPLGQDVREDVRFVGYFFRLQAYEPASAKPGAQPLLAPSFIGRVAWQRAAPGGVVSTTELPWMILLAGGVAIALAVCLGFVLLSRKKRNVAYLATDLPPPPTMSVEEWLDRVDEGAESTTESDGHADDQDSGEPHRNGHSNGSTRLFSDRRDGS